MGVDRGSVCTSKQMCVSYTWEHKQGRQREELTFHWAVRGGRELMRKHRFLLSSQSTRDEIMLQNRKPFWLWAQCSVTLVQQQSESGRSSNKTSPTCNWSEILTGDQSTQNSLFDCLYVELKHISHLHLIHIYIKTLSSNQDLSWISK